MNKLKNFISNIKIIDSNDNSNDFYFHKGLRIGYILGAVLIILTGFVPSIFLHYLSHHFGNVLSHASLTYLMTLMKLINNATSLFLFIILTIVFIILSVVFDSHYSKIIKKNVKDR